MAKTVKDGWHDLYGFNVFVKDSEVRRAVDEYGYPVALYYTDGSKGRRGWIKCSFPIKYSTLRSGMYRGCWMLNKTVN